MGTASRQRLPSMAAGRRLPVRGAGRSPWRSRSPRCRPFRRNRCNQRRPRRSMPLWPVRQGVELASLVPPTFRTAISALRRNKMRSALTALGVIIGVAAVIAMTEIGEGSKIAIQKTIASMGANNLLLQSGAASSGGVSFGQGSVLTLTPQDADEVRRQCPAVAEVAPLVRASGQVIYGNHNWVPMGIYGTTPSYLPVRDWEEMEEGGMFTDRDVVSGNKVCVVGDTIKRELFQGESPVGKEIRIQNVALRVIGVLSSKGANMVGMDQDDTILAPWTTIKYRVNATGATNTNSTASTASSTSTTNELANPYPTATAIYPSASPLAATDTPQPVRFVNVSQILVKAATADRFPRPSTRLPGLLRERHHIRHGQVDDFNIRDMTEITKTMSSASALMGALLLVVAAISLVVGGVGIMNIMLVSVTERTREIGLRMAVGREAITSCGSSSSRRSCCVWWAEPSASSSAAGLRSWSAPSELADGGLAVGHCAGGGRLRRGRHHLRLLSRLEGLAARSHRGAALRVTQVVSCRDRGNPADVKAATARTRSHNGAKLAGEIG